MLPYLFEIPLDYLTEHLFIFLTVSGLSALTFILLYYWRKRKLDNTISPFKSPILILLGALGYLSFIIFCISLYSLWIQSQGGTDLSFPINSYGLLLAISFIIGLIWMSREARKMGIKENEILNLAIVVFVFSLVGARVFFMEIEGDYIYTTFNEKMDNYFNIKDGGLVAYGGLIFGVLSGVIYTLIRKLPVRKLMDSVAPIIALGIGFMRIGCFLAGCCWGSVCSEENLVGIAWNDFDTKAPLYQYYGPADFKKSEYEIFSCDGEPQTIVLAGMDAAPDTKIWPVQLLSALNGFILAGLLFLIHQKKWFKTSGMIFIALILYYSFSRFLLEFFRNDTPNIYFGFNPGQGISLIMFPFGILLAVFFIYVERKSLVQNSMIEEKLEDHGDQEEPKEEIVIK